MRGRRPLGPRFNKLHPILIVGMSLFAACASRPMLGEPALLDFLAASDTTRAQVVARLGGPVAVFDEDRIVVYGLRRDRAGYFPYWSDGPLPGARFHLVIEFDERDTLRRYTVVDVEGAP